MFVRASRLLGERGVTEEFQERLLVINQGGYPHLECLAEANKVPKHVLIVAPKSISLHILK